MNQASPNPSILQTAVPSANPPTMPPQVALLQMISGAWVAQSLYVVAKLGIADLISEQPKTAEALALEVDAHASSLYRVLRALASVGIFSEDDQKQFTMTPLAAHLRKDVPNSVREMAIMGGEEQQHAWSNVMHSVRTGQTAFDSIYGMNFFEYVEQQPQASKTYNHAITGLAAQIHKDNAAIYDFSGIDTLADIGGGYGTFLSSILTVNPTLNGILFDMAPTLLGAPRVLNQYGVHDRCRIVSGNFFEEVPSADAYILSTVIHDWDDERATIILRNCRRAAQRKVSGQRPRLLLAEMLIPTGNAPFRGKWLDLNMLVMTPGGRERTEEEYRQLLADSGWELTRSIPTHSPISLLESFAI